MQLFMKLTELQATLETVPAGWTASAELVASVDGLIDTTLVLLCESGASRIIVPGLAARIPEAYARSGPAVVAGLRADPLPFPQAVGCACLLAMISATIDTMRGDSSLGGTDRVLH